MREGGAGRKEAGVCSPPGNRPVLGFPGTAPTPTQTSGPPAVRSQLELGFGVTPGGMEGGLTCPSLILGLSSLPLPHPWAERVCPAEAAGWISSLAFWCVCPSLFKVPFTSRLL